MNTWQQIVEDNRFTDEDVPVLAGKLFFEGDKRLFGLERYTVLLFLSTIIATYGVIGDSVATVIGAMIIAPLMRPIMATAAGLVMGNMRRASTSFMVVLVSVLGVVALSWLLTEINFATVISVDSIVVF